MVNFIYILCHSVALAGIDYAPVWKEILFNDFLPRARRLQIPIINDDDCVEETEYFSVNITTDMDCVDLPVESVNITILDDESEFYC